MIDKLNENVQSSLWFCAENETFCITKRFYIYTFEVFGQTSTNILTLYYYNETYAHMAMILHVSDVGGRNNYNFINKILSNWQ